MIDLKERCVSLGAMTATAAYSWLVRKGLDWVLAQIAEGVSPKDFKHLLDRAWASDSALRAACDPPPVFDHTLLDRERMRKLFQFVLERDEAALGKYLFDEQLIDLPWTNAHAATTVVEIGKCAARVTIETAIRSIAAKDSLSREFQVFASQEFSSGQEEILVTLANLQNASKSLAESLDRHDDLAGERHDRVMAVLDNLLQIQEGNANQPLEAAIRKNVLLEQQLMKLLDEKGKTIWEGIQDDLRRWNHLAAHGRIQELEEWIENEGQITSPVTRARAYLLLAHLALVDQTGRLIGQEALPRANSFYQKATVALEGATDQNELSRLARFRAKRLAISGDHEAALYELLEFDDSDTFSTRLTILLDAGHDQEAVDAIRTREFESTWIEEAITAFGRVGDKPGLDRAFSWVVQQGSRDLVDRCRLACAYEYLASAREFPDDPLLPPILKFDEKQAQAVRLAIEVIRPTFDRILTQKSCASGVEAEISSLAYVCCRVVGEVIQARALIGSLKHWRPVHEAFVRAGLRGDVSLEPELSKHVREDYPRDFSMSLLAVDIEDQCGASPTTLVSRVVELRNVATRAKERSELARFSFHLLTSDRIAEKDKSELISICELDAKVKECVRGWSLLIAGRIAEAESVLLALGEEDVLVKQLLAEIRLKQDRDEEALTLLKEAAYILAEPSLLHRAAHLATKTGDRTEAIQFLRDILLLDPNDDAAREQLAVLRASVCDYLDAAEHFEKLASTHPSTPTFRLNQARCLLLSGDPASALACLDHLFEVDPVPLEAVYAKAHVLRDIGLPKEAMDLLQGKRQLGWDDARFVATFLSIAYAAGCDHEAEAALMRLDTLRGSDPVARSLLQSRSTDEVEKWLGSKVALLRQVAEQLIRGEMPWVAVERLRNQPLLWAWFVRTQPLDWLFEDSQSIASHTTYVTNWYSVLIDSDGERRVLPIRCVEQNSSIGLDVTAAFTLEKLGFLERALSFFSEINMPASLLETIVPDAAQLLPNQPSRQVERQAIRESIRSGQTKVRHNSECVMQEVDEYAHDTSAYFTASDLLEACCIADDAMRPARASGRVLDIDQPVLVALETCQLLARMDHWNALVRSADVYVSAEATRELEAEREIEQARAEIRAQHESMWARIKGNSRVKFLPLPVTREVDEEHDELPQSRLLAFDAGIIAQELAVPLLVDDRMIQAMMLNQKPSCHHAAFGTPQLLASLHKSGLITNREYAESLLKLMKWRYRFIVLSSSNLRLLYDSIGLAGLREAANYVHAAMRDPGLFSGQENATPPIPISFRFFSDWERSVAAFVSSIWLDTSIPEAEAKDLTEWALSELLPSIPRSLAALESRIASLIPTTVLAQAIFDLFAIRDRDRGHRALVWIASFLGITRHECLRIFGNVVRGDSGLV